MNAASRSDSRVRRGRRCLLLAACIVAVIALWWLFRPEALFINRHVSEKAPGAVAEIQPVYTGSLHSLEAASRTRGRVNVLKRGTTFQLEISSLETQAAGPFTVALATAETDSQPTTLGQISVLGQERLNIPASLNPDRRRTVLLTNDSHQIVATAALEPF